MKLGAIVVVVLAARVAIANDATPLVIPLGKTIEVKVNYARGWICDDPSLVEAELVTRDDVNYWIVKGVKLGTTQCRVGTGMYEVPSYLFDVRVVAKKK